MSPEDRRGGGGGLSGRGGVEGDTVRPAMYLPCIDSWACLNVLLIKLMITNNDFKCL